MQSRAIVQYHHILNSQETNILFKNFFEIFDKIKELQLHKKRIRKKLRSSLNSSKMAETNRTLNQSIISEFNCVAPTITYGFESARSTNTSGDLMLREDRLTRTSLKSIRTNHEKNDIELANLQHHSDRDLDVSATNSVQSSPRNLLTSSGLT